MINGICRAYRWSYILRVCNFLKICIDAHGKTKKYVVNHIQCNHKPYLFNKRIAQKNQKQAAVFQCQHFSLSKAGNSSGNIRIDKEGQQVVNNIQYGNLLYGKIVLFHKHKDGKDNKNLPARSTKETQEIIQPVFFSEKQALPLFNHNVQVSFICKCIRPEYHNNNTKCQVNKFHGHVSGYKPN